MAEADDTKNQNELLDVVNTKITKERAVFSLLQEKKRSAGTFKVEPSNTLQQIKQFLPQLQQANAKLETDLKDPNTKSQYDIEHIDEETKELIEMNLAVYEDSGSEEELVSEEDESEDADEGPVDENNLRLPGVKKQPNLIEEVVDEPSQ